MPRSVLRGLILTPDRAVADGMVVVEDGVVAALGPHDRSARGALDLSVPGDVVVPGFIDLQVNGHRGHDAGTGREAVAAIAAALPSTGVTAFLPTLVSRPLDEAQAFVREVDAAETRRGARILGAHLEGPFLSPAHRGAHDESFLIAPTPDRVRHLLQHPPRMTTIAPELPGARAAIHAFAAAGTLVSLGHSGATYDVAVDAIAAGARFGTHLFNAMGAFHHREPGLVGALLSHPAVSFGLIADGVHLHPAALALAMRSAPDRCVLTTDQIATVASGGRPAATHADGRLAGSVTTMDDMVRRVAALPGSSLREAVRMATIAPARALGEHRRLGRLRPGLPADITVLDHDLRVRLTMVHGQVVYRAGA